MSATALTISPTKFNEALEEVERWKRKYNGMQQAGEAKAGLVVAGVTIVATEATLGYARGRWGEQQLGGIAAEVWGGAAAEAIALSGFFGRHSEMLANMGHGTLGFAVAMEALKMGEAAREKDAGHGKETIETRGEPVREAPKPEPAARTTEALPSGEGRRTVVATMGDDVPAVQPARRKTGT